MELVYRIGVGTGRWVGVDCPRRANDHPYCGDIGLIRPRRQGPRQIALAVMSRSSVLVTGNRCVSPGCPNLRGEIFGDAVGW